MNFIDFIKWLLAGYGIYYTLNIVYDVFLRKENKRKNKNHKQIFSVELEEEEVTDVDDIEESTTDTSLTDETNDSVESVIENTGIPVKELAKSSIFKNILFY